jgi:SAM-dependent methyltransferase
MRRLDRALQRWRFRLAARWIPAGGAVLDIGCHQGEFFAWLGDRLATGVGYDPLARPHANERFRLVPQRFPIPAPFPDETFDAIVLLATLEHIRDKKALPGECRRLLRWGGRVILTVPSPTVDDVVAFLQRLHLLDGMSVEEHHGFTPDGVRTLFAGAGLRLERHRRFQLGLNNLFVFQKTGDQG